MIYCLSGDEVRSEHEKSSKNVFDKKMWFTKELKKVKRLPHDTKNGRKNNKKILLIFKYINFYFEANWRKLKRQKKRFVCYDDHALCHAYQCFWTLFPSNVSLFVYASTTSLFLLLMFFYFLDPPSLPLSLPTFYTVYDIYDSVFLLVHYFLFSVSHQYVSCFVTFQQIYYFVFFLHCISPPCDRLIDKMPSQDKLNFRLKEIFCSDKLI